jgi:adenylate cyclase
MGFTYSKDYKSILGFSASISERLLAILRTQLTVVSNDAERLTRTFVELLPHLGPLNLDNPLISKYLVNRIKNDPNYSNILIGFPNGDFLSALTLYEFSSPHFITKPDKPLPQAARYALRENNVQVTPHTDTWHYLNTHLEEVASEVISPSHYDPRIRPWYTGAEQQRSLYWTEAYTFYPYNETGITVSDPLLAQGEIAAIVGADLSFKFLSAFLAERQLSASGKVFILDGNGQMLIPENSSLPADTTDLVSNAYAHFLNGGKAPSFSFSHAGIVYISCISSVSDLFGSEWNLVAIAPLDDFLASAFKTQNQIFIFLLIILLISSTIVIYFSNKIASPIATLVQEINKIEAMDWSSTVRVHSNVKEIGLLDHAIDSMRKVVASFSKYIPKELVGKLFALNQEISIGGEKKELSIFFSDIANFTTVAESQRIEVLFPLLAEYFDAMSKEILKLNGTIDKFIGDGVMAFWGAPNEQPDHAQRACDAALLCNAMLTSFNALRRTKGQPEFPTRFGIHAGTVIVGNVGTEDRLNYTIIGDAVNVTARLQEVDKIYHTSIIISENVYLKLGSEYVTRPLDLVTVRGKTRQTRIHELVGKIGAEPSICPSADKITLCEGFAKAYNTMQQGHLREARALFATLRENHPADYPTQLYIARIDKELTGHPQTGE